jgi:diguanylate cyclase (GGDEF)-like protein/PAS domain S-box-containing protein
MSYQLSTINLRLKNTPICQFVEVALASFPLGIVVSSVSKKGVVIEYASPYLTDLTQYTAEELAGQQYLMLFQNTSEISAPLLLIDAINECKNITSTFRVSRKDGSDYWLGIELCHYDHKGTHYIVAIHRDVSGHQQECETLRHLADYDYLTNLPNRMAFYRYVNALLENQETHGELAICVIDLNRFKPVNDMFGHYIGDLILQEIGNRLLDYVESGEMIARIGGDEFAMVLTQFESPLRLKSRLEAFVEVISAPYWVEQKVIDSVSASFGIACYPEHGDSLSELLHYADQQMYAQKALRVL